MIDTQYRKETDSLGEVMVESSKYWGAQTQRSLQHFSIGSEHIPSAVIHALALIKKSAAYTNRDLGILDKTVADFIIQASDEVLSGTLDAHFPLFVWMTGSGTQSNMNVNEVISNRAIELAGGVMGSKTPVHPNDHVNMSQSSNDTFPTAMHIAIVSEIHAKLLPALMGLSEALWKKSAQWQDIIKIGRTHLQDAVPLSLGQEFSGYAAMIDANKSRIENALTALYDLTIGGTAVGTGINTHPHFREHVVAQIAALSGHPFTPVANTFAAQGSHDAAVACSADLKTLANSLFKIANDIRLLSCGPRAGFHELLIPYNEPGSSIMPGKVNPTQCEALAMVAAQVMGNDMAVCIGGSAGYLEMNVYKPLIIYNIMQSIDILSDSCNNFVKYLLDGTEANREVIDKYLHESLMLVTALSPVIGYDKASSIAHYANDHNITLVQANEALKVMDPDAFQKALNPYNMAFPFKDVK